MASSAAQPQTNRVRWASWALWALALAGLLYQAGLTAWLGVTGLLFPYQLDYGEGVLLHFVREWSQGRPIYKGIEGYPYITSNYAPLAILLALALTPALGLTYAAGRAWTLLALAAVVVLLIAWVRREGGRWLPAVAAALLFLGSPYVYHWAPLFRVDLVGLALTLGGLYAVYLCCPPSSDRGQIRKGLFWLAVGLFVAALYAKQSFFLAPAAAVAYLFCCVDRRQAIKMAAAIVLLGGGLFLVINALTHGGFWKGLVVSNVNPFVWTEFWKQQADFFRTFAVLGLLALWYLVDKFGLDRTVPSRQKASPLDFYLLAALASLWFAGKAGAWENYFFEALAAFALCGGLGLARLGRHRQWLYQLGAPLLVLAQLALMWHTPRAAERYLQLTRQSNEAMIPILAGTPDPILSEDMGLLVTNHKALDYYSFQYSQLARAGRWDQAWELEQLRDRAYSMVILERGTREDVDHYRRFTRELLSELDRSYRHTATVGKYELYEPDPLQHERHAAFGDQLALVGWSLNAPAEIEAGDTLSVTVVWQAQRAMATDYTAFAHLVDQEGRGWAGDDHPPSDGLYPTGSWGAGEMVRDTYRLTVPVDAPPGLYDVQVGWYDPATLERLPVGEGDAYRIAVLPVGGTGALTETVPLTGARFGEGIDLVGYAWQVSPEAVQVILRWSADGFPDADYAVFLHLVDPQAGDRLMAQGDAPPLNGRWPTSLWRPGTVPDDVHTIPLPADLRPGSYDLLVGLYDPATGERLHLPGGSDAVRLTGLELP
jgi:hypothetical protein